MFTLLPKTPEGGGSPGFCVGALSAALTLVTSPGHLRCQSGLLKLKKDTWFKSVQMFFIEL